MVSGFGMVGSRHLDEGKENQDFVFWDENKRFKVISLADGVSTVEKAAEGAEVACKALTELFLKKGEHFMSFEKEKIADFALAHVLFELKKVSEAEGTAIEEYASTLASVLWDKKTDMLLIFSLGDCMIAAVGENGCEIAALPDEGEFCCTTVTKGASTRIKTDIKSARLWERVMICSDGAWRLMFDKTKIKKDVCKFLTEGDFDSLGEYLKNKERFDDCSFIAMELI